MREMHVTDPDIAETVVETLVHDVAEPDIIGGHTSTVRSATILADGRVILRSRALAV